MEIKAECQVLAWRGSALLSAQVLGLAGGKLTEDGKGWGQAGPAKEVEMSSRNWACIVRTNNSNQV